MSPARRSGSRYVSAFDGSALLDPRSYGRIGMGLPDMVDLLSSRASGTSLSTPATR